MPPARRSPQMVPVPAQIVGVVIVAWFVARADPAPALQGRGLVILVALVVGVLGFIVWTVQSERGGEERRSGARVASGAVAMATAGAILCWASPNSPGSVLAFMACFRIGARLDVPRTVAPIAATVVVVAVGALVWDGSFAGTAAYGIGFVATALAGANRRQSVIRAEDAELLLAQTQRSHEEQVRAAALGERTRIARDVHDVLAHSLAGLTIQLDAAMLLLERSDPDGRPLQHVTRAHGLAREGLREAREAVGALRGDAVPLATGLEHLAADHRRTGGAATVAVEGDVEVLSPDAAWALLRIAREAVTNVRKHAPSHGLAVRLRIADGTAELEVLDRPGGGPGSGDGGTTGRSEVPEGDVTPTDGVEADGPGAADGAVPDGTGAAGGLAATGGGYGLRGMGERANAIGGTVQAGPDGDGWRVLARVPVGGAGA